jgi:hypothetical protein
MGFRKQVDRDIESTLLQEVLIGVFLGCPDERALCAVQGDLERNVIENYPDGHPALPRIKNVLQGLFFNARMHCEATLRMAIGDDLGADEDCPICAATAALETETNPEQSPTPETTEP